MTETVKWVAGSDGGAFCQGEVRGKGKKTPTELSSGGSKDNVTAVPSLPPSDIYPKHIKRIKKRRERTSSGLRTLSPAFVSRSRVGVFFPLRSPLSRLCDWLTCLFEEIPNVCRRSKTHRNRRRMYKCSSAPGQWAEGTGEVAEETDKDWLTDLWRASSPHPALTLLPFLWSIKMNSN